MAFFYPKTTKSDSTKDSEAHVSVTLAL